MFLTSRLIITVMMVFGQFYFFAQETNVLLPQKRFTTNHLKTTRFNDGSSLEVILESDGNHQIEWSNNVNKPQVLVTNTGNYLYNYKAINDPRNICPSGFKVLEPIDLVGIPLRSFLEVNLKPQVRPQDEYTTNLLVLTQSQVLLDYSDCENFNDLRIGFDPLYSIGLKGEQRTYSGNDSKYILIIGFDRRLKNGQFLSSVVYNSGLQVRCVEVMDYNYLFSKNTFSYTSLRFENLEKVTDSLRWIIQNSHKVDGTTNVMLIMEFNESGKFKTKPFSNPTYRELDVITKFMNNNLERPFYQSINIKTIDTLTFSIEPNTKKVQWDDLNMSLVSPKFTKYIKDKDLHKSLNECIHIGARAIYKLPNNLVSFAGPFVSSYSFPSLKKVICPGPINSIFAIIPGLGVSKFKNTHLVLNDPQKVLLSISLSAAAIGIASKAISLTYYNRFRYNLDGADAGKNYQIANTSQKVFVVSSALYAGLALVDFTWTFSLGVKSKNLQHKTNKELRTMHKQNLWL
jgi:hypothetical protein